MPHRIIASLIYKKEFSKNLLTSIGLVYEGAPNYATSMVVNGDVNGDGISYNDLMFVPANASQIVFANQSSSTVNGVTYTDTRSSAEMWNQLNTFIQNHSYLKNMRGQFAERNGFVLPWTHKVDMNFTQDIKFMTGKTKHTLRFTADIYNLTNLLNKDWGVLYNPTTSNPLGYKGLSTDGKTPIYYFNYQDITKKIPYSYDHTPSSSIASRWQLQIGVRYLFN